ncbi:tellurite resistance TerB family protein [uncultured Pseudoteredinibacter sp.]|uniref:tellurite resistance TerB family protein n=1 Tax=uncultured Pseudoteredinibacter sp. TaxID=1641701 RepID=UPI0026085B5B|nr:tellurite resistance TerB family protein [uncultured Pseudoteredinibacter sp.]
MFDAAKIMNQLLGAGGSHSSSGKGDLLQQGKQMLGNSGGGFAGGAAAGGLAGYLLGSKKGRKMAKKAAKYGGMALVAGLAYKAYNNYQSQKQAPGQATPSQGAHSQATPGQTTANQAGNTANYRNDALEVVDQQEVPAVPQNSAFALPDNSQGQQDFSAMLISAMIAAAKADGQIDGAEHQAIFGKIEELGLDTEAKAFVLDQLNKPLDIDSLVASAANKEQAVELYLASLMAIEVDTAAEQAYMNMLAARLELEPELVAQIHQTVAQAQAE